MRRWRIKATSIWLRPIIWRSKEIIGISPGTGSPYEAYRHILHHSWRDHLCGRRQAGRRGSDHSGQIRGGTIIGGTTYHLMKGDVIVIPSGIPHLFKEVPAAVSYYVVKVPNDGTDIPVVVHPPR